jgi:hypothetical protein
LYIYKKWFGQFLENGYFIFWRGTFAVLNKISGTKIIDQMQNEKVRIELHIYKKIDLVQKTVYKNIFGARATKKLTKPK